MVVAFERRCNGDTRPNFWLWIIASLYDWLRSVGWSYAAFSAAASTIRTTSAMMRFNSKSFGV
jgi:hypothetical protein